MSDPRDEAEVLLPDARIEEFGRSMMATEPQNLGALQVTPRLVGDLFGKVITAQPVIAKRDVHALMQTLRTLAETFGDDYIYAWDVNDKNSKRKDGKTTIEGPTINLANDLAREFGNNDLDVREVEGPNHWIFYGRFTDLQTGSSLTRAFRQRKNAAAGKYEDDRKLDIAYQIGQSKCLRNVVVNALRSYSDFMFKVAKGALIKKIEADPERYLEAIARGLETYKITLQSAEATVGRPKSEWDRRDIAKIYSALKAIAEGLVDAREAFPQDGPSVDPETGEVKETESSARKGDETAPQDVGAEAEAGERVSQAPTSPAKAEKKVDLDKHPRGEPEAKAEPATKAPAKKAPAKKPAALF